jgi:hypothetical protein
MNFITIIRKNKLTIFSKREILKIDDFVKSPLIVMPDVIRHPEPIEFTGFRCLPLAVTRPGRARPAQGQARTPIRGSSE